MLSAIDARCLAIVCMWVGCPSRQLKVGIYLSSEETGEYYYVQTIPEKSFYQWLFMAHGSRLMAHGWGLHRPAYTDRPGPEHSLCAYFLDTFLLGNLFFLITYALIALLIVIHTFIENVRFPMSKQPHFFD